MDVVIYAKKSQYIQMKCFMLNFGKNEFHNKN